MIRGGQWDVGEVHAGASEACDQSGPLFVDFSLHVEKVPGPPCWRAAYVKAK